MKLVAFNGSPKSDGNTYHAIRKVCDELENEGIEVEIVHVGNQLIRGCMACNGCARNKDHHCVMKNDKVNEWIDKMVEADAILLGSPVHYAAIPGTMKSFLDRAFYVASVNDGLFRHKVGLSVVADRRAGGVTTFGQLNNFLSYSEMVLPTSNYWNVAYGTKKGEVEQDDEGMQIMSVLGKNTAWIMKIIEASKDDVIENPRDDKIYTNFIR